MSCPAAICRILSNGRHSAAGPSAVLPLRRPARHSRSKRLRRSCRFRVPCQSQGGTCTPTPPATTCGTDITNPSAAGAYLANGFDYSLVNIPNGIKKTGFSRAQWKQGVFSSLGYTNSSIPSYPIAAAGPGFTNPTGYGVNPVYSNQGYNSFQGPGYLAVDAALHKKIHLTLVPRRSKAP